jgi:protein tyrosine/serine phosphatase
MPVQADSSRPHSSRMAQAVVEQDLHLKGVKVRRPCLVQHKFAGRYRTGVSGNCGC